jgi:hypothetical protein
MTESICSIWRSMHEMVQATPLTFSKLTPGHKDTVSTQLPLRYLNLRYKEASYLLRRNATQNFIAHSVVSKENDRITNTLQHIILKKSRRCEGVAGETQ